MSDEQSRCPKCGAERDELQFTMPHWKCGTRQVYEEAWALQQSEPCRIAELEQQLSKAVAFKEWVHNWLDHNGVPADPNAEHNQKTGCRIGGRLEWLKQQLAAATETVRRWERLFCARYDNGIVYLDYGRISKGDDGWYVWLKDDSCWRGPYRSPPHALAAIEGYEQEQKGQQP